MFLINFGKSFFDFERLTQFDFFIRYLCLVFLSGIIISIDQNLLLEVNQNMDIVNEDLVSDEGYFFIKIVQFLSFLLFWLSTRRFKDVLNLKSYSTITFSLFLLLYLTMNHFEVHFILIFLLLLIPARKKKTS